MAVCCEVDASNTLIMCKLFRSPSGKWEMQALGMGLKGVRSVAMLHEDVSRAG